MDPIETAIRNAFGKGDATDRAFREKVYRSAFAALDKSLKSNPSITVERAIARRKALQAKITAIETEFVAPPPAPEPTIDMGAAHPLAEPAMSSPYASDAPALDPDMHRVKPRRRRRPVVVALIVATVLALLAIGGWWAYSLGLFQSAAERDTAVRTQADLGSEDFAPEEGGGPPPLNSEPAETRDWINIFTPADPATVRTSGGATAEALSDETGTFLRMRSGSADGQVLFDVGEGVLSSLRGRSATFTVVARGADGQSTEITVECNLAGLGDCGRRRFQAGADPADLLFEVSLPDASPGSGGTIALNSDVTGGTGAVDIYAVRVATGS